MKEISFCGAVRVSSWRGRGYRPRGRSGHLRGEGDFRAAFERKGQLRGIAGAGAIESFEAIDFERLARRLLVCRECRRNLETGMLVIPDGHINAEMSYEPSNENNRNTSG